MSRGSNIASSSYQSIVLAGGIACVAMFSAFYLGKVQGQEQASLDGKKKTTKKAVEEKDVDYVYPPLPEDIVRLLNASRLCFLGTSESNEPHLSLMNFTYYKEMECIIMGTRRDTKKYEQMLSCPSVAVLIHDFPHLAVNDEHTSSAKSEGKTCSITLNGYVKVWDAGSEEEAFYRKIHLDNNPDYKQFIGPDNVAIFLVRIEKARLCNIQDKVTHWDPKNVKNGSP